MKYFTDEWWGNGCKEAKALFEQYEAYILSIQSALPSSLIRLHSTHTLHDSKVKWISADFEEQKVTVELSGWDIELTYPMHYTLYFKGVSTFEQDFPKQEYVELDLGDLGYWEIEKVSKGIAVRMLFASSTEFRIVFQNFDFEHRQLQA